MTGNPERLFRELSRVCPELLLSNELQYMGQDRTFRKAALGSRTTELGFCGGMFFDIPLLCGSQAPQCRPIYNSQRPFLAS